MGEMLHGAPRYFVSNGDLSFLDGPLSSRSEVRGAAPTPDADRSQRVRRVVALERSDSATPAEGARRPLPEGAYERFLPVVRRTAMHLARRLPREVSVQDLVSCGWVGLLEALERRPDDVDPAQLENYVVCRARGAMLDFLRGSVASTRGGRRASREIQATKARCRHALGREPSDSDVASSMGVELGRYKALAERAARAEAARVDSVDTQSVEVPSADCSPDEEVLLRERAALLEKGVEALPERLKQVLALYYQHECTLKQIGEILGVTESRVSQLHSEALRALRASVGRG